jgi:hypothetical protein
MAMAEQNTQVDFVPVTSQDIMAERTRMWLAFGDATKWSIGGVIGLLAFIYLIWG